MIGICGRRTAGCYSTGRWKIRLTRFSARGQFRLGRPLRSSSHSFFICAAGSRCSFEFLFDFLFGGCFFRGRARTIFLAIASPLDAFGGLLLQVHMIQHLLLMMVAPPLILAGAPYLPILSGLPRVFAREVVGPFLIWTPVKRIGHFLFNPVVCWIAFTTSNVLWHRPGVL